MSAPMIRGIARLLPLPLLVARVGANHVNLALPAHQLAVFADALDARSHLHWTNSRSGSAQAEATNLRILPFTARPSRLGLGRSALAEPIPRLGPVRDRPSPPSRRLWRWRRCARHVRWASRRA